MKILSTTRFCLILISSVLLSACASVKVYDKDGENVGVKFYTAKPYILVTRTGAKDKPSEVKIVHLPDLANPQFAKMSIGFGTAKMNLKILEGTISDFGGEGDSKATELLGALTAGFKTVKEANLLEREGTEEEEQADQTQIDFVRNSIEDVLDELPKDIANLETLATIKAKIDDGFSELQPSLKAAIEILGREPLEDVVKDLPSVIVLLKKISTRMTKDISKGGMNIKGDTTEKIQNYLTALSIHKALIESSIDLLVGKEKKLDVVELYEIVVKNGVTSLRRVDVPQL